ncbi:MAG TPA: STAS domain-containing protein [Pseudonocardiaceae bacterium]|nr:STAS domain-containing protein [Pseudonocardiaceae bacterium]
MTDQPPAPSNGGRPPLLTVQSTEQDGVVVVGLAGELDMSTADQALTTLRDATVGAASVVVDMTGLRFFASAGLNVLLYLRRDLSDRDVVVRLVADQRAVLRPLELMGVVDQFPIHASLADALVSARP